MLSKDKVSHENIFVQAKRSEKKYEWVKAAAFYEQAMDIAEKMDFLDMGEVEQRIGYSLYQAAFQAEIQGEFRVRMQLAAKAYEKAAEFFEKTKGGLRLSAKALHCKAMIAYISYWLSHNPSAKSELLDECWRLEEEALNVYDEVGDQLGAGRTCIELATFLVNRLDLEFDIQMRKKILDEALSAGERAIQIFSRAKDERELARAYYVTSVLYICAVLSSWLETKRRIFKQKAFDYAKNAIRISESVSDKFLLGKSTVALGFAELDLGAGSEAASVLFKKAIKYGIETKDQRILAAAFDGLASSIRWSMEYEEDPEKLKKMSKQCEKYATEAIDRSILINDNAGIRHSYSFGYVQNYVELARREINLEVRYELLKKAVAIGKQGLKHAQRTGSTHAIYHSSYGLLQALYTLSSMEIGAEKKQLLEEAMALGERLICYDRQLRPCYILPQAWSYNALALILFELSKIEKSKERRKELLKKSISHMEEGITILQRYVASYPRKELFAWLSRFYAELGNILNQLYRETTEKIILRKLIESYQNTAEVGRKADFFSRVAEAYWKIAKLHTQYGDHVKAAQSFEHASKSYLRAAKKVPQLKLFYQDYAAYMRAWEEIERAKHNHLAKCYEQAKKHYKKAANILGLTRRWTYLSSNYLAWAKLEEAENASQKIQSKKAKDLFLDAAKLFMEAKKTIKVKLDDIEAGDERKMATDLIKASDLRHEYCLGRIAMEEAVILERHGKQTAGSEKYEEAIEKFQKIAEEQTEQNPKELKLIIILCQAWQKMLIAEKKTSPALYKEAAKLFEQARENALDHQTSLIALANSCLCKALEAGAKFEITRDTKTYLTAKKHMEACASHFIKANFETASTYAKAITRLFDAYMYMSKAETETLPRKRAQYYEMAEKLLQASSTLYEKAKHLEKSKKVQRLLKSVKEDRKLAISLAEMRRTPTTASIARSFLPPNPTYEKAVGLERFERASVEAYLTAPKEVTVGDELDIRLDIVNVAKNFGLLVRIENLVPLSFRIKNAPSQYDIERCSINMKGKKLEPLIVESITLSLQATEVGVVNLSPRIVYVNDVGKFKVCKIDPVTITVYPRLSFEFKVKTAEKVFDYLIRAFQEDYMKRKMSAEKSGWRTMMDIVKYAKVPKSSIYGTRRHPSKAISELKRRGLVEIRVFPGERGRGGRILKMRIAYEKETIKRLIDKNVMKIKEK